MFNLVDLKHHWLECTNTPLKTSPTSPQLAARWFWQSLHRMTRFWGCCLIKSFLWLWADLLPLCWVWVWAWVWVWSWIWIWVWVWSWIWVWVWVWVWRADPPLLCPLSTGVVLSRSHHGTIKSHQSELFSRLLLGYYLHFIIKQAWSCTLNLWLATEMSSKSRPFSPNQLLFSLILPLYS